MHKVICLIILAFTLYNCKKDPEIIQYIEYRDPFIGTYKGTILTTKQYTSFTYPSNWYDFPAETIDYRLNAVNSITKSSLSHSSIHSSDPDKEFPVSPAGTFSASDYRPYIETSTSKLVFRNDSVHIEISYKGPSSHGEGWTYVTVFDGKK